MNTKNVTLFQKAIDEAHSFHRLVAKTDLGKTKHDAWVNLSTTICDNAYAFWKDNHDDSGRAIAIVDETAHKANEDALFNSLNAMVEFIGKVDFSDHEGRLLTVNEKLSTTIIGFCTMLGYDYNEAVKQAQKDEDAAREVAKAAKAHFDRYNFNGVSEDAKQHAADKLAAAEAALEAAKALKAAETKKKDAKTAKFIPNTKDFRLRLELHIYDMLEQRQAQSYEDYLAERRQLNKEKRERRKANKAAAEKQFEQAEAAATEATAA